MFVRAYRHAAFAGVAAIALMPALAVAQESPAADSPSQKASDIVVTGTLIRGQQVTGSQTITVDTKAIEQVGAVSTNQLLASIPQFGNFNDNPGTDARSNSLISVDRIRLRNLPGFNKGTGSVTLTMMDGHRITPVGVYESTIDADIIPTSVVERVDVVTDGGSSLYGADAISGVVNFVTKKKFDGVKIDGNFGFGTTLTTYKQFDGSIIAGKSWSTGGAYISLGYDGHTDVKNGDTSWSRSGQWSGTTFLPQGTQCINPVGTQDRFVFLPIFGGIWTDNALAGGGTVATGTKCDNFLSQSYFPKSRRYNMFASAYQELSDNVELRVTGYYTNKKVTYSDYPIGMTTSAQPAPTGAPGTPGAPASSPVLIDTGTSFSFGANPNYRQVLSYNQFETWGVTPELKVNLGSWQVHSLLDYGESYNHFRNPGVNLTLAQSDIDSGVFTPATVASLSAAELNKILDWETATDTKHQQLDFRLYADGPIFTLPGGDAKVAVGVEYQYNEASTRSNIGAVGSVDNVGYASASQNAKSIFGELTMPVFSMLDLSASVRYDHYNNFGGTTNPTLAAKFKPFQWLSIFGHWGKSFNAPTAMDLLAVSTSSYIPGLTCSTAAPCVNYAPGAQNATAGGIVLLSGSTKGLQPQTATEWTLGFDAKPTSRFNFGVEYYNIHFRNILGSIDPSNPQVFTVSNPEHYAFGAGNTTVATTNALYQAINGTINASDTLAQIAAGGIGLGEIVDFRVSNVSDALITGIDFHANLEIPSNVGDFTLGVNGNKALISRDTTGVMTDHLQDGLVGSTPTFSASTNVGWALKNWSAKVTVNYSGAYNSQDYAGNPVHVSPFVITNLFLGYKFGGDGPLSNSSLRLIVDNIFNRTPQIVPENSPGPLSYKGWTLGRVIKLGATVQF